MEEFKLSDNVDSNKVFIVRRSELEERFESEYYKPSITSIESIIRKKSNKKLRDFIKSISSGATPSVTEEDKFYSDKENGIPFLRVQNLQTNGEVKLDDVKFINYETHNNYLKRSQVKEGDLLIKITGVGRMAIASVAPKNFNGNTNQHMVVIKTDGPEISKYLANYLNLDIIEKLASRRSTGGTRPALDYKALKSIPIIEGIDFSLIYKSESEKQQKEAKAKALLESIDDYLLGELGIVLPKADDEENDLLLAAEPTVNYGNSGGFELDKENLLVKKGRLFLTGFREIVGQRIDPKLYDIKTTSLKQSIRNIDFKKFRIEPLKSFVIQSIAGDWGIEDTEQKIEGYKKCLVIRATEFDNEYNLKLDNSRAKYRQIKINKLNKIDIQENDLLIEKSGGSPDQPVGRIAIITRDVLKDNAICYSNFIYKIRVDNSRLSPEYLFCYLKTIHRIKLTESMQSQTNGIRNLAMSAYFNQDIVIPILSNGLPDLDKQIQIAEKIQEIRQKATELQQEAESILNTAKQQVEQMILGN